MVIIKCSPYEKGRLLRVLEKAKQQCRLDYDNSKITREMLELDIQELNELISRVNGIYSENYLQNSKIYREKTSKVRSESEKYEYK